MQGGAPDGDGSLCFLSFVSRFMRNSQGKMLLLRKAAPKR